LAKVTFAPKYIPYKTLSKFELAHFLYLNWVHYDMFDTCMSAPVGSVSNQLIVNPAQLNWKAQEPTSLNSKWDTDKFISRRFLLSPLHVQLAFCKFQGRYNGLVCQYNLPVRQMLSDRFHTNH
jgi:hypothetical protein